MKFSEIVEQASDLLQRQVRISYRALKREFGLDDETLEDLKFELIRAKRLAKDEEGEILVWVGDEKGEEPEKRGIGKLAIAPQPPSSYTPHHLAERIRAEQAAMESRGATDGERKTITALFADLKGSTALIEGLDPEDARAIIDPALQLMMDAVHRYDGYVAQALGDGIFALFGAPLAHEDHPQRALYAALRMQDEMRAYSDQARLTGGLPLQIRVGINTGEVVVRSIRKDDLHTDYVPVGHSTNLAARMEQLATPGSIVVSEDTHKLTDGFFEFKPLGTAAIKGVEAPLNVYEVLGAGSLSTRFQVTVQRGLSRFVGRQPELAQLGQALAQAKAGHGQIVGVMGEPGLGKSRLFYEFKLLAQSGCLVLEAFAVSHGKASPYLPLVELLKAYFAIEPGDDNRKRREKVTGKVLALERRLDDTLAYLFLLLGIEDESSSLHQMDGQIRRQRTFEALKKLLFRESLNQPLLLLFEDLHWIDSETQGVLDALSESVASAAVLLLVNYRPEYQHSWGQKTYYTQLRLASAGPGGSGGAAGVLAGHPSESHPPQGPLILERTDGTPFFIEEVVQTLVEEGTLVGERGSYRLETIPTALHIPPTVHGVLAARIDRLTAEEKAVLQQLAVIGRQFPVSLVKQVVPHAEADLYRVLVALQAKEFLYEQPAFPESEYLFKHALTQDVAYSTVLHEQRKALHEQTGQALEELYRLSLSDHYNALAHHYQLSENTAKAVEYLELAGHQAVQRSANKEAVRHFSTAIERLQALPDTSERCQHELALQVALGVPLTATKSWAAPEVETVYLRARELCEQLEDAPELFPVLYGLQAFYLVRAEHKRAHELAEHLLRLAQSRQDSALLVVAHTMLGVALFCRGELVLARTHLEQGSALYDIQQHHALAFSYLSLDLGGHCLSYAAAALWQLGYPEQALQRNHEAVTLAQDVSHPFSLAFALNFTARLHQLRREQPAVQAGAEAAIALSTEQGFPFFLAMGTILRGWAVAEQGQGAAGISQIREGLATYQATGAEIWRPYFLALLAEVQGKVGQTEAGLRGVNEALALVARTEERFYEAELHRLKGELLLNDERRMMNDERQAQQAREAEVCFLKAIEVAQRQSAKSWELRAATSLARLWQQQGKAIEARNLLAPVYAWFTEGFDTADLKDAKALIEELGD